MALKMFITDQLYLVKQSTGKPETPECNCNSKSDSYIKSLIEPIHYLKEENKMKNSFIQSLLLHNSCTRSSHPRCSVKSVLRNFAKSTRKHLCQSVFFNKVVGLRPATLLKKRLWHRLLPVNLTKFLGSPFLQNTSGGLLLLYHWP